MADTSLGSRATATRSARATWHELAAVTDAKRKLWLLGRTRTSWSACGRKWDAVAVEPMTAGLDALTVMRAGTRRGYQVLADHERDRLYIAVPAGSSNAFEGIPGVRVLSTGHQLLTPATPQDGTPAADWVSHPGEDAPLALVAAERLAAHLRSSPPRATPGGGVRVMSSHAVLYDPEGRIDGQMPLDRVTHERVVRAVLAWSDPAALPADDYEQVGLLLSGAAHAVAADVRACASRLLPDDGRRLLAEIVLVEASGRLSQRSRSLHRLQNKARMLRALYERLDRLKDAVLTEEPASLVSP